ncbi:hypothetical protein F5Y00DRAFT_240399 [Daldinia vernicosa]|uniref:uncharacterized protein n=1 Tax=Daldinia vernicosa TaxID=114800 RepID=UPI002007B409|nr:uncharacterized protein F5Y00DRAFT_240399 [Daldinia vernicosa]KAI0847781.1 hypothetical protein F5Y00DRAFT_240399 [Daldinia vernicosa]
MSPVPFQHPVRYTPLAVVVTYLTAIVYLTYAIAAGLYASYKSLGPAQDTRSRYAQRRRLVPIFLGLAAVAFSLATYNSVASAVLSYKTWAHEHGVNQRERYLLAEKLVLTPRDLRRSNSLYITQWLSDTPIFYDALEIVAEKARRFWWGQQIDLATVAFSMLLSVEGRRRNIPLTASFLILAHLVSLSFAQNLFYVALLLTPSPLPPGIESLETPVVPLLSTLVWIRDKVIAPKPKNWLLRPRILFTVLALNYLSIFLLPYAADTHSFVNVVHLGRASTFLPLILPAIAPVSWGTIYLHPHDAHGSLKTIFRTISAVSFALHAKSSIEGLRYNVPDSHHHRHSIFLPWNVEERSNWERSTTAIGKVLGSLYDHPAVNAVGCDVLVCTISLGLWAAVRAISVQDIIASAIPTFKFRLRARRVVEDKIFRRPRTPYSPYTPIRPSYDYPEYRTSEHSMTLRSQSRPGLSGLRSSSRLRNASRLRSESNVRSSSRIRDLSRVRNESRARNTSRVRDASRVGSVSRIGSVASSCTPSEDGTVTPGRRRGRARVSKKHEDEKAYRPTMFSARSSVESDLLPATEPDWDSAAIAWSMVTFAGLGSASAGVLGGECIAR